MFDLFSHPRWTIAWRDVASLSREKTIILAIVIQLFIAAFSSFLVVGLTSLYDPSSVGSEAAIDVAVTGDASDRLLEVSAASRNVQAASYPNAERAQEAFQAGNVDAILVATNEATAEGAQLQVRAIVPAEDLRTTLIVVQLRDVLTELERLERTDRAGYLEFTTVDVPESPGSSPFFGFTYTILLPLLLFLPPFISGSIAVDSLTEELERGTLELLRVSPVNLVDIVDGKALGMVALAPIQAAVWIVLLQANNTSIDHIGLLLVFVTAVATLTVVLGVVLGLVTGKRRKAQLLYSVLALVLFGGTAVLPEHPATTVALLAANSTTTVTYLHVALFAGVAVVTYALVRTFVGRLNPESL